MRSLLDLFNRLEDKHRDSDFGMSLGDSSARNNEADPWWHEDGPGEEDDDGTE